MRELTEIVSLIKELTGFNSSDSSGAKYSPVFRFPFSSDYKDWLIKRLTYLPAFGKRWPELYMEIFEKEIKPSGVNIPIEWYERIISYPTYCIYVFADTDERVLYVGKSEYPAITRIIDRLIPPFSDDYPNGQKMNNVPEIWEEYLLQRKSILCFYCYDLPDKPAGLEYEIINRYSQIFGRLPAYNRMLPKN